MLSELWHRNDMHQLRRELEGYVEVPTRPSPTLTERNMSMMVIDQMSNAWYC